MVTADTTRRALMLATAAAPLAFATPATAHPDADLLQLGEQHRALDSTATAYAVDLNRLEAEAEAAAPAMPEVLRVTADDRAVWSFSAPWWTTYNVDQIRKQLGSLQRRAEATGTGGAHWTLRRAQEVISASDAREAASKALLAATRFSAVEEAYDEALEGLGHAAEQILGSPARTVAGLKVKARLLLQHSVGGDPGPEADFDERLEWSLLSELLALEELA